jgi:hypothetical protein
MGMAIKNVELVCVGTHAAETGTITLTQEDMTSLEEAYRDELVDRPCIKLGHDDNVLNSALGDGEPAYGWVENVTVGDGSAARPRTDALYGDLVGMPAKLEQVAPKAWRRRSVEMAHGVKAASGKAYRSVLTALALLGVHKPAVKGLSDVLALYSGIDEADSVSTLVIMDGLKAEQVSAFSEAVESLAAVDEIDTANIPPGSGNGSDADNVATDTQTKGKPMPITKADVDKALEKAGDEDVTELLKGLLPTTSGGDGEGGTGDAGDGDNGAGDGGDAGDAGDGSGEGVHQVTQTAAGEAKDETVVISKETFTQLSEGAAAGVRAATEVDKQRRDNIVRSALSEGKIAPAEQKTWRDQLDANEETTVTLLGALAPRFATSELGSDLGAPVSEFGEADQKVWDEWSNENLGTSLGASN